MANEEHVAILKQGVEAWNKWRERQPGLMPDLRGADLSQADLRSADFHRAWLDTANLSLAHLRGANFDQASFKGADLYRANLISACLTRTNLHRANLTRSELARTNFGRADLSEADIGEAILFETTLHGAHLGKTRLAETILSNVDLTQTIGLDTCIHQAPSTIDYRTLQYGLLPLAFLRGCGLSDWQIETAKLCQPSLSSEAIMTIGYDLIHLRQGQPALQFHSCFISYNTRDEPLAKRLYTDLQENGVRCWFAPEDLKIGEKFRSRIDEAIHVHDRLLLILSGHSIASEWVEKEVETALEKEREAQQLMLFPIRVDDAVMQSKTGWAADIRRSRHIGDFTKWEDHDAYQQAFDRLLQDLREEPALKRPSPL